MVRNENIERISLYPNDVDEKKRKKLFKFLRDTGIQYSYEAY